jgi:hypothetical protein
VSAGRKINTLSQDSCTSPDQFRSVFEKFGAVLGLQELQKAGVAWELGAPQLELVSEF